MNMKLKHKPNSLNKSNTNRSDIVRTFTIFNTSFVSIRSLQMQLNQMRSTCSKMNNAITQLRLEVNDKMVKKFGMKIDFDEMEETVLTRLLMSQSKSGDGSREKEREIRKLKASANIFFSN